MRILLVWPNIEANNACGTRGLAFARTWRDLGEEIAVAAHDIGGTIPGDIPITLLPLFHDPLDALRLRASNKGLGAFILQWRPDLVVASTPPATVAWQAVRVARRLGVPAVVDVRDLATESLRAVRGPRLRYLLLSYLEGQSYWGARTIMTVSDLMADALVERFALPRGRVAVVPNGSEPMDLPPTEEKDVDALFVGYLHDEGRRPRELVAALRQVHALRKGTRFAFVGWKPGPLTDSLTDAMKKDGMEATIVPPVPRAEVAHWMVRSRVGLVSVANVPIFRTVVGAKTYEYLRAGLALAVLGVSGDSELRRLVDGEGVGIFSVDPGDFALQLAALLTDEHRLTTLSARARDVGGKFDRRIIATKALHEVLEPLIIPGLSGIRKG